ncbi:MAG TPA: hypothetical protein VGM86_34240 [Thermoanaerobaculia bacterium]
MAFCKHVFQQKGPLKRSRMEVLPSWAIQLHPSPLEERLWQRNHVNIFDCRLDEFVERMRQRMKG